MPDKKISIIQGTVLLLASFFITALCGEGIVRAFDVDFFLLKKTLYYQCYGLPLHRASEDAQRLYELVPNAFARNTHFTHPKENKYKEVDVYVNSLGFRGQEFSSLKKAGAFRIIIFGGSNTFGPSVADTDTYPAQMQKILDKKYPGQIEVWNAGISAYVMSQNTAYAETVLKKYDPDLLIFQDTNHGRRAFHLKTTLAELKRLFRKNKELFAENIPFFWDQGTVPANPILLAAHEKARWLHNSLVAASSLYRSICLGFYYWRGVLFHGDPAQPIKKAFARLWNYQGQRISNRELNMFIERHPDKKIIIFVISTDAIGEQGHIKKRKNVAVFPLSPEGKAFEYEAIHPPSHVYTWYAESLCDFLTDRGYLPKA